ncbi:hypothetical protein KIPB_004450 [Kipferlia bialata]|uniref:Peptidyl-prolyl cis-trans isomerase n=1 Tax=Kipferlia bialata TaxID=797122 RepID=A0A9K3GGK7_9EUKA|nr:hypothetical protein KIPB_004450 [Kipferlia bialata]|eukprot:g4450.t1
MSQSNGVEAVRCSHILVKHKGSRRPSSWREKVIKRDRNQAQAKIAKLRKMISNHEASFEVLAAAESDCSSAADGGDLGWFKRGVMQKPFEVASFALSIGELSEQIETSSGIHIIMRTG